MSKVSLKDLDLSQVKNASDALILAQKILPCEEPSQNEWYEYAQLIASALILKTKERGGNGNDLIQHFTLSSAEAIKEMCGEAESSKLFKEGSERMLSSVLSILANSAKSEG